MKSTPTLLVVDDDEDIRSQMRWALAQDYQVALAEDRKSALAAFHERKPDVVLLDLGLPPYPGTAQEGLSTLSELLAAEKSAKIIIISGQSERENALQAVSAGAYDFLNKPVEMEELKIIIKRAFHVASLEAENRTLQNRLDQSNFAGMMGNSTGMQDLFAGIRKVAGSDATVLILGDSGTGKEMAAQAIHERSLRKDGPFIAINCGAIPENLLESELFGHEKGSFTGAHATRQGRVETADGGTLFLDEVGELPLSLQVKLLRYLQEQSIERVGGRKLIPVNTRVIAATNVDLKKALLEGRFREDLYYRLAVVVLRLPPLRHREGDIELIANAFLKRFAAQNGKDLPKLSPEALRAIHKHDWPGNVRELENRIKRAIIMAEGSRISAADLELSSENENNPIRSLKKAREELEREMILEALRRNAGNVSRAATDLEISRPTLYELIQKLEIKVE